MIVQAERDLLEGAEASSSQAAGAPESAPAKATSFATSSSQEPEASLLPVTPGALTWSQRKNAVIPSCCRRGGTGTTGAERATKSQRWTGGAARDLGQQGCRKMP